MTQISLTIGKLATAGGVGVETVRYYQREGLLETPERQGGIRRYDGDDLQRLRFIRKAQQAGFTLREIHELITLDATHDHHRAYELARKRIAELDIKIAEMQQARDSLKKLAGECSHAGKTQPCAILAAFDE